MRLFISHIHEEDRLAETVKLELEACFAKQVTIFLARDIPLGRNWLDGISKALKKADMILSIFSRASSSRPWINIETGYGVMAGKQVIPLCHSGFTKADLPVIYGLLQAMEMERPQDVGRLLDQIAKRTRAGTLLVNRKDVVDRWISKVSAATMQSPVYRSPDDAPPCVWIVGSNRGLPKHQSRINRIFMGMMAQALMQRRFRAVFGRSGLLDHLATSLLGIHAKDFLFEDVDGDREILGTFAKAAALQSANNNPPPNPVIVLGTLRAPRGPRAVLLDAIGRVPDVVLVIGGDKDGRTAEEVKLAQRSGIPLLPLRFTGGCASDAPHSFDNSLRAEVDRLQVTNRDYAAAAQSVCDLVGRQASLSRSD